MLQHLTYMLFFGDIHVFLHLSWIVLFEQREHISTLKQLSCRKYLFQKLSKFSKGNIALDAADSNTHCFLLIDTCVSATWLSRPIKKWAFPHLETYDLQEVFLSKTKSILTGKHAVDVPDSHTDGFVSKHTCVSQLCWIDLFGKKWAFPHLERYDLQEVFLSKTTSTLTGKKCAGSCSF
jgi:hypothetical protein